MNKLTTMATLVAGVLCTQTVSALEVDRSVMPRLTIGGRVIATVDHYNWDSNSSKPDAINTEDSTVLLRMDKRLYENGVAGAVVGMMEHADGILFNQLHAFYWDRDMEVRAGRMRLRNTMIELPLLREDDDFLAYSHVGNASSNEEFDQKYGDLVSVDWFVDRAVQDLGVWFGTRRNGTGITAPDGFDTHGVSYQYAQPEEYRYLKTLRHAGITIDRQQVSITGRDEWLTAIIAATEFNLNQDPRRNWSMALQGIHSNGAGTITGADITHANADAIANRVRAKSNAMVMSWRYTDRPNLLTRSQLALNLGYKTYADVDNASQWSVAPSYVYRLGSGVDVIAQAAYTHFGEGLGGGNDTTVQVGVSFSLESTFNDSVGERKSILNLEHGYIQ